MRRKYFQSRAMGAMDRLHEIMAEAERIRNQHYGFGKCLACGQFSHCAGELDPTKRHENEPERHVCRHCGGVIDTEYEPPF